MPNLARKTDPSTSHMAADELIKSGQHKDQKAEVLHWLKKYIRLLGHCPTSQELSRFSKIDRYKVARRLPDLEKTNEAGKYGQRICTISGKMAVTWTV